MRFLFIAVVLQLLFASYANAFVTSAPVVKRNEHILRNATPEQCQAAKNGTASPGELTVASEYGQSNSFSATGVRSCSDCAVDPQSRDCVCSICYYYYN